MATEEERLLYAGAVNYADAAQIVISHPASDRVGLILPVHTLLGLAIELAFKAVFLYLGGDAPELKKVRMRHNLAALRDECVKLGFATSVPQIDQIVTVIGVNYAAHEYRYMKPGGSLHYVNGAAAVPAVQKFIDEVAQVVGLPVRPEVNAKALAPAPKGARR
jgi:hypothetical protein